MLSINEQVTSLCCSFYFQLHKIASIRPYLSDVSTAQLISSLILSRPAMTTAILPSLAFHHLHWTDYRKFKTMLPGLYSANKNLTTLLAFWKTTLAGSLLRPLSTTKLPQLLSGALRILFLQSSKTNCKPAGNRFFHFQAAQIWNSLLTTVCNSPSLSSSKKNPKHIFLKNTSLLILVCKAPFLCSLTTEWMCVCVCWGGGVCFKEEEVVLIWLMMTCAVEIYTYLFV